MLGSRPFIKTSPACKTKKLRRLDVTLLTTNETGANYVLKLKYCVKMLKILNYNIELNKIHLYFIIFQKFRRTVKFGGKTLPFNVLE